MGDREVEALNLALKRRLPVDRIVCLGWYSLDVLFTSSTIIHLCTISIDRYFALKDPIKYRQSKRKCYIALKICLVWVLALCIAGPLFISTLVFEKPIRSYKGCGPTNTTFIVSATVISFYLPLFIMLVTYILTIITLKKQTKLAFVSPSKQMKELSESSENELSLVSSGGSPCQHRNSQISIIQRQLSCGASSPEKDTQLLVANGRTNVHETRPLLTSSSYDSTKTTTVYQHQSIYRQQSLQQQQQQQINNSKERKISRSSTTSRNSRSSSHGSVKNDRFKRARITRTSSNGTDALNPHRSSKVKLIIKRVPSDSTGHEMSSTRSSVRRTAQESVHKGRRAVHILGILFVVFVVFYLPFFSTYVIGGVCESCQVYITPQMITAFEWLGYTGSMVNPIIYRIFNPDFRKAFQNLMRCRYRHRSAVTLV
ncbi:octopamine receptor-like isoform X2 [Tubulanus polymorphus]|uniref:octopamine receptor-like isoform X2 n=1 Tax=Tubulanus polymorphus TaxID=672921 RepID=UPI003DA6293B